MADDSDTGDRADAGAGDSESNASLLAELEQEMAGKGAEKPGAKDEPDEDDIESVDDDDDADLESDDEGESDADGDDADGDDEDAEEEPDDEAAVAAKKDPELAKRLAAVERTERRHRERRDRERTEFDRERSSFQTETKAHREQLARFEQAVARAKYDPAGVLEALGLSVDDMGYAGEQAYARSKAAAADPKYRQAADRAMREREMADGHNKTAAELAELKQSLKQRDDQAAADRVLDDYFGRVTRKATDETPRVKALIAADAAAARAELEETAFRLAKKLGRLPKPAQVLAAHEKQIARMLRRYGVDGSAPAGESDKAEKKPDAAGRKPDKASKAAKPAAGAKPAEHTDRKPNGEIHHPSRDELLAELRDAT